MDQRWMHTHVDAKLDDNNSAQTWNHEDDDDDDDYLFTIMRAYSITYGPVWWASGAALGTERWAQSAEHRALSQNRVWIVLIQRLKKKQF